MAATSRGIDVSSFQGAQDWAARVRGGLTYALVKATEGQHSLDDHYQMHMSGLIKTPLLPGAYHFAWPCQPAAAEAAHYTGVVREAATDRAFVHMLDLERNREGTNYAGMSNAGIRAYAEAWIDHVRASFPHQRVIVYTSADDIAKGRMPRNSDGLMYPAYPNGPLSFAQAEQRGRPAPSGLAPLFWQFASETRDGQSLDQSIAYMTPAALRAWAGATEEDMPLNAADLTKVKEIVHGELVALLATRLPSVADAKHTLYLSDHLRGEGVAAVVRSQGAGQSAAIAALAAQLGKGGDVKTIVAAVEAAIAAAVVHVDVDVTGTPTPAAKS